MCEPWCWPPEVVARLTDRQIERIRKRQADMVRAMSARPGEKPPEEVAAGDKREQAIAILMDLCEGKTYEQAAREYDASEGI